MKFPKEELEVCLRVGFVRRYLQLSQHFFSMDIALTRDQLSNIESGRTLLRFWTGWRLCQHFNINQLWLASGDGSMRPFIDVQLSAWNLDQNGTFRNACLGVLKDYLEMETHKATKLEKEDFATTLQSAVAVPILEAIVKGFLQAVPVELRPHYVEELLSFSNAFMARVKASGVNFLLNPQSSPLRNTPIRLHSDSSVIANLPKTLEDLIGRVRVISEGYGDRAKLARFLGVPPQRVRDWLSGERSPGGDTTLRLLEYWVTKVYGEETTKQKAPESATNTNKGETRKGKQSNAKTKSGPKEP